MADPTFTEAELAEFNTETLKQDSLNNYLRVEGRLAIKRLIAEHGQEKCNAMWAELMRREKRPSR